MTAGTSVVGRPAKGYVRELDGLRAFAVAVVILSHLEWQWAGGGKSGVLVFFVLSGYLITTVLLRELASRGSVHLRDFYTRRALRLFPAMVLTVLATALYALAVDAGPLSENTLQSVPAALLYLINWQTVIEGGAAAGYFGHFWSLAVEEQFYIVWPLLLILAYRLRGARGVAVVALAGALGSVVLKAVVDLSAGDQARTDFAADGLLLGCGLAAFVAYGSRSLDRTFRVLYWPAVAAILAATAFGASGGAAGPDAYAFFAKVWWPVVVVASAIVIGAIVRRTAPPIALAFFGLAPLVYLGRISYGMYLWHILVIAALPVFGAWRTAAVFAATVAIATASFYGVERPFLRMKARFERGATEPARSPDAAPSPSSDREAVRAGLGAPAALDVPVGPALVRAEPVSQVSPEAPGSPVAQGAARL